VRVDALPEEVGLAFRRFATRELPVDFIPDVAHGDETYNKAIPSSRLHGCRDSTVVDEPGGRQAGTSVGLGQDHGEITVCYLNVTSVKGPVINVRIAVIFGRVGEDTGIILERVTLGFTNWAGFARVQCVGREGIASSQTKLRAGTTKSILAAAGS